MFPKLTRLELKNLPQLSSFYPKRHASWWPFLEDLEVVKCDKVRTLATEFSISQKEHEMNHLVSQLSLFSIKQDSFLNLENLVLGDMEIWNGPPQAIQLVFRKLKSILYHGNCAPFSKQASFLYLQRLQNLEKIEVQWNSCEEIFVKQGISSSGPDEEIYDDDDFEVRSVALPRVRTMSLYRMWKLMHLGNDDSRLLLFPNLENLKLFFCHRLKCIESSEICFQNLTSLKVYVCGGLEYLTSYSVAKSLLQLRKLKVWGCDRIVVMVSGNGDDDADAAKGNEIYFSRLQNLELEYLTTLQGFYSGNCTLRFPSSMTLNIHRCRILKLKISPDGVLLTETEDQDEQKGDPETVQRNPEISSEEPAT